MAKKKPKTDRYEYIKATVDGEGNLSMEYKLPGVKQGRQSHDEDVSEWTDDEIRICVRQIIGAEPDEDVEVAHD